MFLNFSLRYCVLKLFEIIFFIAKYLKRLLSTKINFPDDENRIVLATMKDDYINASSVVVSFLMIMHTSNQIVKKIFFCHPILSFIHAFMEEYLLNRI